MKQLSSYLAIGVIATAMLSCNKENIEEPVATETINIDESSIIDANKYPEIKVENNVLCFATVDYYISVVSDESETNNVDNITSYLQASDFNSYGKKMGENSEYDEPFMDAIMNEDKVVKIGEWFIYIDMESETVVTISDSEENAYEALLNGTGRTIRTFSTGDDVLFHLVEGTEPQDRACGGIGGGNYETAKYTYDSAIQFWAYVKFFRAGIYYRLTGGYKSDAPAYTYFNKALEIKAPQAWCKRKNCGSGTISTWPAGVINTGYDNNYVFELYENVRNLNGYYLYVRAIWPGITTPWVGRNINSPY